MERLLEATCQAERRHFWFRGFRRFVRPLLARATAGVSEPMLLDCGCGTGSNLAILAEFGRPFGLDYAWAGVRRAAHDGQSRVMRASVVHLPFADAQFDLVTSFDVLYCLDEHDDREAVEEMFRVLRPGGRAIVNVAAMRVLRGNHSVLSHELRRYTQRGLRRLLEGSGFVIERLTYTNATLFPLLLPLRVTQRLVGLASEQEAEREIQVPILPFNAFLASLLYLEALVLRLVNLPFGSSLLGLAKKPA